MAKKKFDKEKVELVRKKIVRRHKPKHLRVQKKLGPKSGMRNNRGKY